MRIQEIPNLDVFLILERPEPLCYVCLSVCPSVRHTCGQRHKRTLGPKSGRATKTKFSREFCTSRIQDHGSKLYEKEKRKIKSRRLIIQENKK